MKIHLLREFRFNFLFLHFIFLVPNIHKISEKYLKSCSSQTAQIPMEHSKELYYGKYHPAERMKITMQSGLPMCEVKGKQASY